VTLPGDTSRLRKVKQGKAQSDRGDEDEGTVPTPRNGKYEDGVLPALLELYPRLIEASFSVIPLTGKARYEPYSMIMEKLRLEEAIP